MTKILVFTFVLLLFCLPAIAQIESEVQHAASTVAHLHDEMLNPPTFVLDAVYVTKPDKRAHAVSYCYEYRSQNQMGGISEGRAVEDGSDKGRLSTFVVTEREGLYGVPGYNAGWFAPCKPKNIDHEITKEVAAIAPTLYKKDR